MKILATLHCLQVALWWIPLIYASINSKLQYPLSAQAPRALESVYIGSFKIPPLRATIVFKCPTQGSDLKVRFFFLQGKNSDRDFLPIHQTLKPRPCRPFSKPFTREGELFTFKPLYFKIKHVFSAGQTWDVRSKFPASAMQPRVKCPWVARGDFEVLNWSVHYIVMDCLDLPAKTKIEQLTFSWVLYFTSFVFNSQFPVLLSSNTVFISVSLFCKSNYYN